MKAKVTGFPGAETPNFKFEISNFKEDQLRGATQASPNKSGSKLPFDSTQDNPHSPKGNYSAERPRYISAIKTRARRAVPLPISAAEC